MKVEWHPEEVTAEIEKKAMDRLEMCGDIVAEKAQAKFPLGKPEDLPNRKTKKPWKSMDTGTLRDTIRVVRLYGDPKLDVRVYAGNRVKGGSMKKGAERGAFYAHMVEFGTVKMAARPFLRPALNSSKSEIKIIMGVE